jgi:hypothetical protein
MEVRNSLILLAVSTSAFIAICTYFFAFRAQRFRSERDAKLNTAGVEELKALGKRERRCIVLAHVFAMAALTPIPPLFRQQFIGLLKDIESVLAVGVIAAVVAFVIKKLGDIEFSAALKPIKRDFTVANWILLVVLGAFLSTMVTIGFAIAQDEPLKKAIQSSIKKE